MLKRRKCLLLTLLITFGIMGWWNIVRKRATEPATANHLVDKKPESVEDDFYTKYPDQRPFWSMSSSGEKVKTKWDKKSPIMFLHIGKSGGTSFDS